VKQKCFTDALCYNKNGSNRNTIKYNGRAHCNTAPKERCVYMKGSMKGLVTGGWEYYLISRYRIYTSHYTVLRLSNKYIGMPIGQTYIISVRHENAS
jgi:hypothetical protein